MEDLRHRKILFEAWSVEVRQALLDPQGFPDLTPLILKLLELLNRFEDWSIIHVSDRKNSLATDIVESITSDFCTQLYVASGGPCWLQLMFNQEAGNL
ncbi:unnamed protein product [Eruca vesicaria subsp. sativa]|uniref:RNase H type-1 domain-containing protein n=1 Tax=Eruca vesicaria subsp. sativa TaxID=29727 RepID=A0ABC8M947_ERUVS|nr:unnamed protein product [Eruca vesicaria subsp. sativa]